MILEVKLQIIWFLKLTGWRGSLIFIYSLDESLSDCNERTRFVPKLLALFYLLLLHFPSFTSSSSSLETRTGFSDSGFINYKKEVFFFKKMSLGKRSRAPMRKTPSMTEITFDLGGSAAEQFPPSLGYPTNTQKSGYQQMISPRNYRRHSIDLQENASFLRACSLCTRPLVPGRDIYMYR